MRGRLLFGWSLFAVGVTYLLEVLAVIPRNTLAIWWPLLLVLIGINLLVRHPYRPWGGGILVLLGVLLEARLLQLLPANFSGIIWALVVIIAGLLLLWPRRKIRTGRVTEIRDRIDDDVSFGTFRSRNDSAQFQGGKVTASFSNYELDLRGAHLTPDGADLVVQVSFGGLIVRVPDDWIVQANGQPVFGSFANKTLRAEETGSTQPVLRVTHAVQFGSVEIQN
ncbi:MAG TPA: LiaF domain-containing protein [Armatimonadota bacterium]|jgi:predicted membrane protein